MWEPVEGLPEWVNDLCAERWQIVRFIWEDSLAGEDCSELFLEWDRLDMELKGWVS